MADVASTLAGWSNTDASNNPQGSTTIGTGLDDNLRAIQGVVVRGLSHKGSDIASSTTADVGAVEGLMHDITGTTGISSLGTVRAGIWKILKFEGALTLTHNATSLILPGAANITTADGDVGVFVSEGSGNWRCTSYVRADGMPAQGARFKVGTFTRDVSTATGTQAVTGVGFKPKALVALTSVGGGSTSSSAGFTDGTSYGSLSSNEGGTADNMTTRTSEFLFIDQGGGNLYQATISSFDSDGFTVQWTKTSSPTGTYTIVYLALR